MSCNILPCVYCMQLYMCMYSSLYEQILRTCTITRTEESETSTKNVTCKKLQVTNMLLVAFQDDVNRSVFIQ